MKSPPRNNRLTLQRLSQVAGLNDFDEQTEDSWEDLADRWAGILTKGFRQFWRAGQETIDATHLVEMTFDSVTSTLTVNDRLFWRGRILRIMEVADTQNERKELLVVCRETTGMGDEE